MPKKKILITCDELTNVLNSGSPVEEVLNMVYRLFEKNFSIQTPGGFERISQCSIEKNLAENIVIELIRYLKKLDEVVMIKITPLVKGEIFELEVSDIEDLNNND